MILFILRAVWNENHIQANFQTSQKDTGEYNVNIYILYNLLFERDSFLELHLYKNSTGMTKYD